jgi:tryptophanyl-tRNA synthetase
VSRLTDYYHELREQYGYTSVDRTLRGMSTAEVRQRFAFADGLDSAAVDPTGDVVVSTTGDVVVSTGVSVTGPPHVGTLGQLLTTLSLRDAGFDARVVFADLVVYHAHGVPIETASVLAERYREFALALGFDSDELHIQSNAHNVLHTAQLLARYHKFDGNNENEEDSANTPDPPAFEVALTNAYEVSGESPIETDTTVEPTEFGQHHGGHLLVADQLHPLVKEEYETVIVIVGADNHRLAAGIREVLDRSPYSGTLTGLYTRLVTGYDGYPKLSKSIPASRFTLDTPSERIRERVMNPGDEYSHPTDSLVFQMLCLASPYAVETVDSLREACTAGDETWKRTKREYAEWLVGMADVWKATRN